MQKVLLVLALMVHCARADRVYDTECPAVKSVSDFDMERFLGVWYQVQPDLDSNDDSEEDVASCEHYNLANSDQHNKFIVNTQFEIYPETTGPKPVKYESTSTNYLTTLDDENPATMSYTPTSGMFWIFNSNFLKF